MKQEIQDALALELVAVAAWLNRWAENALIRSPQRASAAPLTPPTV